MRIVHLNNHVGTGGVQRVMIDLGAGQVAAGHQVFTVASPVGEWWNEVAGHSFPIHAITGRHGSPIRMLRTARALRRALDTIFPDVVHVHQRPLALALALAQVGRRRVAVVEHAHTFATDWRQLSYRWCDAVIAPGDAAAAQLRGTFPHAAGKVHTIVNAVVDPGRVHDVADRSGPIRVLAVGRVEAAKDPQWFVMLIDALRERHIDVVGRWLGDGHGRADIARRTADARIPVDFPGSSALVRLETVAADVVVSSSIAEAMPIALVEALAHGRAVVARDVGSIGELVENGSNGLLVHLDVSPSSAADELAARLGDDPRRTLSRWGCASRARYERSHNPAVVATAVMGVYREVLAACEQRRAKRSLGQILLAPVAMMLLHGCDFLLRVAGLERALRVVGARGAWDERIEDGPTAFAELGPTRLRLAWAIQRAGHGWSRTPGPCLRQALAHALVLRRYSPIIHFGVRRGSKSPTAHAWTTVGALRFDREQSYRSFEWRPAR